MVVLRVGDLFEVKGYHDAAFAIYCQLMAKTRQMILSDDSHLLVRSMGMTMPGGYRIAHHQHPWPQLVYAVEGALGVETPAETWVVPPSRAVWVPAGLIHSVEAAGPAKMRTLYVRPDLPPEFSTSRCQVLNISPLLREMILHVVGVGYLEETHPPHRRLAGVLLDQIKDSQPLPLSIPMLKDPRARQIVERVLRGGVLTLSLQELAQGSGASLRTLERVFQSETGLTFGRWRQQARLLQSLHLMADGAAVGDVAHQVGYDSTSAFVAMFRRSLGTTPGRYLS